MRGLVLLGLEPGTGDPGQAALAGLVAPAHLPGHMSAPPGPLERVPPAPRCLGFLFRPSVAVPCHPGLSSDVLSGSQMTSLGGSSRVALGEPGPHAMFGGESWTGPCLSLHSCSSPACSWSDLKTMISFYLVLFYATLISLSRQVSSRRHLPAQPPSSERAGWAGPPHTWGRWSRGRALGTRVTAGSRE